MVKFVPCTTAYLIHQNTRSLHICHQGLRCLESLQLQERFKKKNPCTVILHKHVSTSGIRLPQRNKSKVALCRMLDQQQMLQVVRTSYPAVLMWNHKAIQLKNNRGLISLQYDYPEQVKFLTKIMGQVRHVKQPLVVYESVPPSHQRPDGNWWCLSHTHLIVIIHETKKPQTSDHYWQSLELALQNELFNLKRKLQQQFQWKYPLWEWLQANTRTYRPLSKYMQS